MATNNQSLAFFLPKDANVVYGGNPASATYDKRGNDSVLRFPDNAQPYSPGSSAEFEFILPRGTSAGYTATTGLKVIIAWSSKDARIAGAVRWAAGFSLCGQTDLPNPTVDTNFPAASAANEIAANTNVNSTTAGGITYTTLSCTIAAIQNGQTTAPAAGDHIRLRVRRANLTSDTAGDTLVGHAYIHSVEIQDY